MNKPKIELLPFARVSKQVGLGRSSLYQRIKEETFPRPVSLGAHCVRWRSDEIDEWINSQIARDDAVQANTERAKKASSARQLKAKQPAVISSALA